MAYTIVKSNGTVLTTIADGTINTTSTSLGLPGRNYAGYGQTLDTNFVHQLENFADNAPPSNPLQGQLWYNTNDGVLYVCPTDGETNAANWLALTATASGGTTTFGQISVTGNIVANNIAANNYCNAANATFQNLNVTNSANLYNANLTGTTTIANTVTTVVTSGSATTAGTVTGVWTVNGSAGGLKANAMIFNTGGIYISNSAGSNLYGIKCDLYMYANGDPISFAGTYSNSNVQTYLPTYNGNILSSNITTPIITTGANTTPGQMTGNWTLTAGSRLQATYADLAERFEADTSYDPGTVVELGGSKEITAVKFELSEDIFGVISNSAAYLMNSDAGNDYTHPAVAVSGRVQVKVVGSVQKGDRLVSAGNGIARAAKSGEASAFNTIGRSLVNKLNDKIGFVEAIVSIR